MWRWSEREQLVYAQMLPYAASHELQMRRKQVCKMDIS